MIKGSRLIAAFLLGVALFNYPILALFNRESTLFGIPILFFYIFVAWGLLIGLLAIAIERRR